MYGGEDASNEGAEMLDGMQLLLELLVLARDSVLKGLNDRVITMVGNARKKNLMEN